MTATGHYSGVDLIFLAEPHEYRLPDGRPVPNVTSILRAVGVSTDFEAIKASSRYLAEKIDEKRDLGTAVHADIHAFDDDDIEWDTVHERVLPYVDAWSVFRENTRLTPMSRERRVFHPSLFYCGTLDGIFLHPDGKRILIDVKTGDPDAAAAHLQTAAYQAAYEAEHPTDLIDERWSVRLCPERTVPYQITNYSARPDAWRDAQKFQACLTVFYEQPGRRNVR